MKYLFLASKLLKKIYIYSNCSDSWAI